MILSRRKKLWKKITLVSPSRWLANCAKNSVIFSNKDIRVIRTGVELDVFNVSKQTEARKQFNMNPNKTTLLFGAHFASEIRKGFHLLLKSLKILLSKSLNYENFQILIIGGGNLDMIKLPIETIKTGFITDRAILAKAYSAADITIMPYLEDNLPNFMLESIACGTPVAAFKIGGIPEVITEGINGITASPYDCKDLACGIERLIKNPLNRNEIRSWAVKNLDIRVQSAHYLKLFNELIKMM
jgi:glycosyltransferase involved in cell wall biosynthesis